MHNTLNIRQQFIFPSIYAINYPIIGCTFTNILYKWNVHSDEYSANKSEIYIYTHTTFYLALDSGILSISIQLVEILSSSWKSFRVITAFFLFFSFFPLFFLSSLSNLLKWLIQETHEFDLNTRNVPRKGSLTLSHKYFSL